VLNREDGQRSPVNIAGGEIAKRLGYVRHKVIVLSGKGGVGKSFITANLAVALSLKGFKVAVLDADMHGPSIPRILGVEGQAMLSGPGGILPVRGFHDVAIVSTGLMMPQDEALVWRGPLKTRLIMELLASVNWGELDFLLVDLPPGTGDEAITVAQMIEGLDGAVMVTTPSELTRAVVKRAVTFCRRLGVPLLGIVNNMCCFKCPSCGAVHYIFGRGVDEMAADMGVRVLADIPLDPRINESIDRGVPLASAAPHIAGLLEKAVDKMLEAIGAAR